MITFYDPSPRQLLLPEGRSAPCPAVRTLPAAGRAGQAIPVAAYCRVSTLDPSQEDSLEVQTAHWKQVIAARPDWVLTEIYAERQSGTHAETREALMRLIAEWKFRFECAEALLGHNSWQGFFLYTHFFLSDVRVWIILI